MEADQTPSPILEELKRLYYRDQKLTPSQVVEEAADPASPLHHRFEWDDEVAAFEHRLAQARRLIKEHKFVVYEGEQEVIRVPVFLHERETMSYRPTQELLADDERRAATMAEIQRELRAIRKKLEAVEMYEEVVAAIDAAL